MERDFSNKINNYSNKLSRNRITHKSSRFFNINFKNYLKTNISSVTCKTSCEKYKRKKIYSFTKLFPSSLLVKRGNILPSQRNIISKNSKFNLDNQYNLKKDVSMKYQTISDESLIKPKSNLKSFKSTSRINLKMNNNLLTNKHVRKTNAYIYKSSNNLFNNKNNKHITESKKLPIRNKNSYYFLSNNNSLNFIDEKTTQKIIHIQNQKHKKNTFINSNNYYFFLSNSINIQKNGVFPKTKIFVNNNKSNCKIIKNSQSYKSKTLGRSNGKKTVSNHSSQTKNRKNSPNYSSSPTDSLKNFFNQNINSDSSSIRVSKNTINTIYNINKKKNTNCCHEIKIKNNLKKNNILNSNNVSYYTSNTNTNNNTQNNTNTNIQNHSLNKLLGNNHQNQKPTKLILTNHECLKSKINLDNNKKIKNKKNTTRKNLLEMKDKEKNKPLKFKTAKETINITIDNTINNIVNINSLATSSNKINYNIQTNNNTINLNNDYKENSLSLEKKLQKITKKKKITFPNKTTTKKVINKKAINQIITNNIRINTDPSASQAIIVNKQKLLTVRHNTNNINRNLTKNMSKSKSFKDKKHNKLKENVKKIREEHKKKNIKISLKNLKNTNNAKLFGIKEVFTNLVNRKFKFLCKTPKIDSYSKIKDFNFIQVSGKFNKTQELSNRENLIMNSEKKNNTKIKIDISNDPQYSYEYINEIFLNLLIEENNYFEKINMETLNMNDNKFVINPESRKFFINSLINIQDVLNISEHTLFLTVQIFDRYINEILSKNGEIVEENLDIVIVTSLIIAAKREELKLYPMSDYLNLLPDKYSLNDLIKQEFEILNKFCFELLLPNSLCFFELLAAKCKLDKIQYYKGLYLLNVILLDSNMLQIPPSLIAYSVITIISGNNCEGFFSKLNDQYEVNGIMKKIKIIPVLKDSTLINSLCEFIKYSEKSFKESVYNSVINKFNTPGRYFVSSYISI